MEITQVGLSLIQSQRSPTLQAVASFVIDNAFVVKDVKVIKRKDGSFFVAMPSTYVNGEFRDICHPVTSRTRELIETAVLDEFNKATESNAGKPKFGRKLLESKGPVVGPSLLGSNGNVAGLSEESAGSSDTGVSGVSMDSEEFEKLAKEFVAEISQTDTEGKELNDTTSSKPGITMVNDKENVLDPALLDSVVLNT